MESVNFCYWLQGFFEISEATELNEKQIEIIKKHLSLVFIHEIDPSLGDEEHQARINEIHSGNDSSWRDAVYSC